jgi:hypothetical protein
MARRVSKLSGNLDDHALRLLRLCWMPRAGRLHGIRQRRTRRLNRRVISQEGLVCTILKTMVSGAGRRHAGDQPPPSSTPIPSCQIRNASNATPGVQDNIIPKNTACKVVMGFHSLDVTFA